jgi:NAD(P)-dependent dehydrogenase (short-subunit alcohol dehydrogenase family)
MELHSRTASIYLSALTSEIRRAANAGEIHRCATHLNSGDFAMLLSGTRLAAVESADILSCGLALKLARFASPEEIVAAIVFPAGENAGFITGQTL